MTFQHSTVPTIVCFHPKVHLHYETGYLPVICAISFSCALAMADSNPNGFGHTWDAFAHMIMLGLQQTGTRQ